MLGKGRTWIEDFFLQEMLERFDVCLDMECMGGKYGYICGEGNVVLMHTYMTLKFQGVSLMLWTWLQLSIFFVIAAGLQVRM